MSNRVQPLVSNAAPGPSFANGGYSAHLATARIAEQREERNRREGLVLFDIVVALAQLSGLAMMGLAGEWGVGRHLPRYR
jgi:hypothetical protein